MFVEINDNRLDVEVLGDAPGKPTMIVHHGAPGLGSKAEPRASFAAFADTYRVVVFDARGSGASEGNPPFTHEQWAADVDGLRAWAGAERIVMAGGSYGGFIAMEYAIRYPDRVAGLVLRDTAADNANQELALRNALASSRVEIDRAKLDRIMSGTVRDDADLRDCWAEILPLYDHDLDWAKVRQRVETTPYRYATHNFAFSVNQPQYDITPLLPRITCPTLVTVGRHDWITPVACSETIAALIPQARLEIFEHSGHSPQVEEAEKFQAVVRAFLAELPATTA
ncbi:alpha/beta fold hydrolase [Micromonospora sp. NPDC051925]|uniref:alpha/beta fold hydrolase n=1 Tax=unclassified Micromonospora TaxID=2617518 RepID=UPI001198C016|nr:MULTISPECIES: alpha/beta hydrolase [unclassified Micromonospora]QDY06431.1 alpha/beta hydrolase [Micromonospora sp. HM134]